MFRYRKFHNSDDHELIDDESPIQPAPLTRPQMLDQAAADWRAYERAKELAAECLAHGDTLGAQNYNQQAQGLKAQAEKWEQRARTATE